MFGLIVIGAGSGGLAAAKRAALLASLQTVMRRWYFCVLGS